MHIAPTSDCEIEKVKNRKNFKLRSVEKRKMHVLMDYLEQCFQIMTVVVIAELIRRCCRIIFEYWKYANHYEDDNKLLEITKRSFSMNISTSIGFIVFLFVAFVCVLSRGSRPPLYFFTFMPLYWIFMGLAVGHSHLNYADWIREPHGLDYAEGMASNYFHGYLKLILPTHDNDTGIKERMQLYENKHKVKFAVKRLFILVPNTMFINSKIESKILQKDGVMPLETVVKNRAGVSRPFKNDVYRFNRTIDGTYYYVAMEGATPMLSFFEALSFQPSTTWQMKEMKREILLKFYKHLKYLLNKWPETQGKAEVILYNSYKADGRPQDVGDVLLSYITNMWHKGEF
ncbi:stimulator of interferon genes protein [Lucilia cuprina]|uniref:stimulator of interferon genes protein n=1 Tax=Lucilia cuprina TaxID=7375 RepID=UPI001F0681FC|nr:stimulator of interferon genes protein [Lucilia cuprina]XP_046811095.1 stimulator of interferon genes protein [Lucilia cuprina]